MEEKKDRYSSARDELVHKVQRTNLFVPVPVLWCIPKALPNGNDYVVISSIINCVDIYAGHLHL